MYCRCQVLSVGRWSGCKHPSVVAHVITMVPYRTDTVKSDPSRGDLDPPCNFFLGPPESISQAATRSDRDQFVICSDVFVRLMIVFNRQTDRQTTLHL